MISGSLPDLDRFPLGVLPLLKQDCRPGDEFPHNVQRNGDLAMAGRWSNENKPAPDFNVRRLLGEKALVHAVPSPCSNTTEQLGIRDAAFQFGKRINALAISLFDERMAVAA